MTLPNQLNPNNQDQIQQNILAKFLNRKLYPVEPTRFKNHYFHDHEMYCITRQLITEITKLSFHKDLYSYLGKQDNYYIYRFEHRSR